MQQLQKFETRTLLDLKCYLFQLQEVSPFLTIFIASYPFNVCRSVLNDLKPMPAFANRLIGRCSYSMMLFKYFFCRSSVVSDKVSSAFKVSMAFGYALPSILC